MTMNKIDLTDTVTDNSDNKRISQFNSKRRMNGIELLAPAGSFDAALAAFQYGADAVYLGLNRHSARAEALNFSEGELKAICAYAHGLKPVRAVYLAINTLVRNDEIGSLVDSLAIAEEAGVDAVIIQDIAVYSIAKRYFPKLTLHASTQMCVHNVEGARAMKEMGFERVVFARELTFREIDAIVKEVDIETEVFIQGALCYGYSGHCLFSALSTGRSGNRGQCAYCCRERFFSLDEKKSSFPFSMRDLSISESVNELCSSGVTSLKIEGRMKSPLYVAAAVRLYRLILDGVASEKEIFEAYSDLQSVFSRPSTRLYYDGREGDADGIIDAETVGHRGTPIGQIDRVRREGNRRLISFTSSRALELHDGIQVDLPGRPYGFAVGRLYKRGDDRSLVSTSPFTKVEIELPGDAPILPIGAEVYCSSSQAVHRNLSFSRPRGTELVSKQLVELKVIVEKERVVAEALYCGQRIEAFISAELAPAQKPEATFAAVEKAFARTGESAWGFKALDLTDDFHLYVPMSILNELRRLLISELDRHYAAIRTERIDSIKFAVAEEATSSIIGGLAVPLGESVRVRISDSPRQFDCCEVVLELSNEVCSNIERLSLQLDKWRLQGKPIRIALPQIVRGIEAERALEGALKLLIDMGITAWECADLASLHILKRLGAKGSFTASSNFYAYNMIAASEMRRMGIDCAVIPVEADDKYISELLEGAPDFFIVPICSSPSFFISETAPVVPWEKGSRYKLKDKRGNLFEVERYDGLWHTRRADPCIHTAFNAKRVRRQEI